MSKHNVLYPDDIGIKHALRNLSFNESLICLGEQIKPTSTWYFSNCLGYYYVTTDVEMG